MGEKNMNEPKETVTAPNSDGIEKINQKMDEIIQSLKYLRKIRFASLILQTASPVSPVREELSELILQEGVEWLRELQSVCSPQKRRDISFLGDLSELLQNQDIPEE